MALDISAVGAKVIITGNGTNITIDEFSDEGTPFEAPDIDVSTNAKNLNGTMISSRTPSVYPFSITVIPGSAADIKLQHLLMTNAIMPGNNAPSTANWFQVTIQMPQTVQQGSGGASVGSYNKTVTYTMCRIKSGPTGPSTSADGRMSARTYTFEAEGFSKG